MLFVFGEPEYVSMVMRDCTVPLDLLYLDADGRVVECREMKVEPPRTIDERADGGAGDAAYESRLPVYLSSVPASFALELPGGTIRRLNVKAGDAVTLPPPWSSAVLEAP